MRVTLTGKPPTGGQEMTAFLFGLALGFIAGFAACLVIAQKALNWSDSQIFEDLSSPKKTADVVGD
jgi:gas vesicle protein